MTEFKLITQYFQRYAGIRGDVILGIGDDCALLQPPAGQILASSTDTMLEAVHFLPATSAAAIGYKSLAISLSDLAAMGAEPAWVLLSITLPKIQEDWIDNFCAGFSRLLTHYNVQLVGGNTSKGPLSITTSIMGFVPPEQAITRSGAKIGDKIYITGFLGEAGLALQALQNKLCLAEIPLQQAQQRLDYPTARVAVGMALRGIASAAIDISDGLAADLGHILQQSQVGARIEISQLPLSPLMQAIPRQKAIELMLTAGDDYELCFTVAPERESQLQAALEPLDCPYHCIGRIEAQLGLTTIDANGQLVNLEKTGYEHF